jgi:acyl-CoA synthetase (AMP-forming)/AMP-acid ligase II
VDRKPDLIVSGGENVYSAEVERVLVEHPLVLEAAVLSRPDERWGEAVVGVVVRTDPSLTPEDLVAFCRERLAEYKCPKDIMMLDDAELMPRNPMGKVQKFRVRKELVEPPSAASLPGSRNRVENG